MTALVDTSAWIEFIRRTGSAQHHAVRRTVRERGAATTDAIRLEVLAGTDRSMSARDLMAMLDGCADLSQEPRTDVEAAAEIYRVCRRAGETIRSLNDCLVAAIAIRHAVPVLHRHRDFDVIARHSDLQVIGG